VVDTHNFIDVKCLQYKLETGNKSIDKSFPCQVAAMLDFV
jgi:hypothetical protein